MAEMKRQINDARRRMEEDDDLSVLMAGLRGKNIDDSDFAADGVQMKVVDLDKLKNDELGDELPLYYDPELIASYWSRRPAAVAQRVAQLATIGGSFITGIVTDFATKSVEENSVKRAIQLREIVTSLGPAYIKLGQALSIRPDILTPAAMNELQKLCDKVPSFDNKLAFATLEAELGCKWQDVYSELGPDPVAAASLGQVYKGVLKENGEVVAVKVQRPAVLETVSIDLYVLRKVGVFLKQFPAITTDVVGSTSGRRVSSKSSITTWRGKTKQSLPRASPRTCLRWSFLGRTQSIRDVKLSRRSGWRVRSSLRAPLTTSATW